MRAKLDYLATTPDLRGLHEKALLETAVFGLPMLGVNMPAGRGPVPAPGGAITPTPVPPGPGGDPWAADLRPCGRAEPDDEHDDADERPEQHSADGNVALGPERCRLESRRAGAAARRRERHAHRFERRPPRRRLPRRDVHRLHGGAVDGCSDDGATRRPRPVRLARLLPDAAVEHQLLRRARRVRRHEPARHSRAAPRCERSAGNEHAAQVHEPRPAALLQRQPDERRPVGRTVDRQHRGAARRRAGSTSRRRSLATRPRRSSRSGSPIPPAPAPGRRSTSRSAWHLCPWHAEPRRTLGCGRRVSRSHPPTCSTSSRPPTASASSRSTTTAGRITGSPARSRTPRR